MTDAVERYRAAVSSFARGNHADALAQADAVLRELPRNAAAHALAGVAALQLGRLREAMDYLRQAEALDPGRAEHPAQLARALLHGGSCVEALSAADRAMALGPAEPATLSALGFVYSHAGAPGKAADALRRVVAVAPGDASAWFNLATLSTFTGDLDAAVSAYERCIAIDPAHWRAHLALAQGRRWTDADHHVARLESLLERHRDDASARLFLELALAKELEDLGRFPEAFGHLSAGKAAQRARRPYAFARDAALFDALSKVAPGAADPPGNPDARMVFVVGMPRTGTTLVDRILSSHPAVRSLGERFDFPRLLKMASGTRSPLPLDPATVEASRAIDWARLGAGYLAAVGPAGPGATKLVDKFPHNFLYLGFILRALPNASVVCLRRERLDTCVANYRQLLAPEQPLFDYSFDLLDTGRYVLGFERLMEHWHRMFPGRILEVGYEALVADQAMQSRRLLDHCGLEWDDACLAFHRNEASVATASAVQVREPLHGRSIGRWRDYAPQLRELRVLLDAGA